MKRIFASVLLAALAFEAGAQNWMDALNYAENDYLGTARSVGMGNAMTAVGGDLGSLTFNPAGSAVASYSQFTITPGLSISSVIGQGTDFGGKSSGYEDRVKTGQNRFNIPNFGAVMVYDTRRKSGLKRVSFGLVGNMTRDFNNRLRATGSNGTTTLAGSLASQADGYDQKTMTSSYFADGIPSWETMVGYQAGLFNPLSPGSTTYVGLTERYRDDGQIQLADRINQYYGLTRSGNKYDLLMNIGLDFSDRFYLGANVGVASITYRNDEVRSEEAAGSDFPSGFSNLRVRSVYIDEASGVYAKVGFIARPFDGLRIGAAIQTPTLYEFQENYELEARAEARGESKKANTPEDEWYFNLKTPLRFNAGVAYTFGKVALLSADYELCDYSTMLYSPVYDDEFTSFSKQNQGIHDYLGTSHIIRVGGELKPSAGMALRVGYNYATSPEIQMKAARQSVSFGLGLSTAGSFFADFAVRFLYLPEEYITPYYYYSWDNQGTYIDELVATPEIDVQSTLCNALVTLGWRF